jgi:hypothetical protein
MMLRHSSVEEGQRRWSDTGKPLRAAPKLKPPALPGDTYFHRSGFGRRLSAWLILTILARSYQRGLKAITELKVFRFKQLWRSYKSYKNVELATLPTIQEILTADPIQEALTP